MRERRRSRCVGWRQSRITPARAGKTLVISLLPKPVEDHPRSCGKDGAGIWQIVKTLGSPPLVRERRHLRRQIYQPTGITPARAGKTKRPCIPGPPAGDHPRSCGKDYRITWENGKITGSPPLVRERLVEPKGDGMYVRITPARAGKTERNMFDFDLQRDHPRSCGKDLPDDARISTIGGSPPLVRERPDLPGKLPFSLRITPARAGKTNDSMPPVPKSEDHPRSCGKDSSSRKATECMSGSPPLVRERPQAKAAEQNARRITPARAGKTSPPFHCPIRCRDHPRSCGKDISSPGLWPVTSGSPPLVRERLPLSFLAMRVPVDHPRSCGKDCSSLVTMRCGAGSPPLVRERHEAAGPYCLAGRITPARAGKTCPLSGTDRHSEDHPRSCGKDWHFATPM